MNEYTQVSTRVEFQLNYLFQNNINITSSFSLHKLDLQHNYRVSSIEHNSGIVGYPCRTDPTVSAMAPWCLPVELAEAFLVEAVPDVDEAVRAAGRKRVVVAVERDRVHREDLLHAILLQAMTLERILLLLHLGAWVEVLDGHAACSSRRWRNGGAWSREEAWPGEGGVWPGEGGGVAWKVRGEA